MTQTTFWWVRHGPTHARTMIGWTDLPADLSDQDALTRLSDYLPDAPIISSDLKRARETADAIQGGRHRLDHDPGLRELHFGHWEDLGFDAAEARDGDRIRSFWDQPGDISAPGGESWNTLCSRVTGAADRLSGRAPDVIVVAHMGPILTQVQRGLNLTAYEAFSHRIEPLSVTVVSTEGVAPISHLP